MVAVAFAVPRTPRPLRCVCRSARARFVPLLLPLRFCACGCSKRFWLHLPFQEFINATTPQERRPCIPHRNQIQLPLLSPECVSLGTRASCFHFHFVFLFFSFYLYPSFKMLSSTSSYKRGFYTVSPCLCHVTMRDLLSLYFFQAF